jgi:radical SAM/Cys-rich protein
MHATLPLLRSTDFPPIRRRRLETLQVNLTYRCNQSCAHCHVAAGPKRTESMSPSDVEAVLDFLHRNAIGTLDLTGGAPEMHSQFREIVTRARAVGARVIDRCNLTILAEPGHEDLADFLAANGVEIVASLPCYLEDNVDRQRGGGVFAASVAGIARLNALGYGVEGTNRLLHLVYNPQGPVLPPAQPDLEADYKRELMLRYGITFNRLYTLANMPIQRFGSTLVSKGGFGNYLQLLRSEHSAANLDSVMCRSMLSVDWQGHVYDCDFNQMLGLHLRQGARPRTHLSEVDAAALAGLPIRVADHCYGCTAGQGSSCGGALAA